MKLSNFRDLVRTGNNALDWNFSATVDVTTGYLWWKKTRAEQICRSYVGNWFFVSNGEYTPDFLVERMERVYKVQKGMLNE